MSVIKYKDPSTGEIKKVFAPTIDAYTKSETDTLLSNKAPAGFGLGEFEPNWIDDCNNAVLSGWYSTDSFTLNTPGGGGGSGVLLVSRRKDLRILQEYSVLNGNEYSRYTARRSSYGDETTGIQWGEWEYINPPFDTDVVYRTTERHLGNPVYKKMDSNGVIWWSTDQSTWKCEAERVGAAPSTHASQHASGGSDPITLDSIAFLGINPISSTTDDTTTNWANLGSGFAWYNAAGKLDGQPSQYGHLISYIQSTDVFQIWNTQAGGPTYFRSGNNSGWNGGWRKVYDTSNKPTPSDIGAAASSHNHSASNITSGTLSAARGGTGQTTVTPDVGTKGVRQIYAGTTDMTASSTSLTTGVVYLVYQ